MKESFDFKLEPGKKLKRMEYETKQPEISVIIPFYNDEQYIEQSVNSVLNQTFPCYEILVIDDGSKDEQSLKKLEEIQKMDSRIKVFHKENEGLAATRDYGASKATKSTKYLMFLDSDDLIESTFLECAYWALETNEQAGWAYSDSIGFDAQEYTWNKWFNSEKMKKVNDLVSAALVRKTAFEEVKGYELRERAVNEDWNFWLKLIAKGYYPVHMSYYGEWYRRKKNGELKKADENKERAIEIIQQTAKKITKEVKAIQYPKQDYNYNLIPEQKEGIIVSKNVSNKDKINILMIVPWLITGGADKFNLDLVQGLNKEKYNITIITTDPNKNVLRQQFEQHATIYELPSFLDQKYWLSFINYIIEKENINLVFNTNSKYGYSIMPYLKAMHENIPIIDYIHMEEWYNRNGGYSRDSAMLNSAIDKTLTCNENSRKILCNYFGKKEEETKTVYIGVDEEKYNPEKYNKQELLEKYKLSKSKKILTYICRITEQKRPMLLLNIVKQLKQKRNDFQVLVVGSGNLLEKMKQTAKSMNIEQDIMFLGNIEKTEEIYKVSDLTINCSIKEGLALTSYESLAMGVPVVSSDVGGQKELINSEVGALIPCTQNENDLHKQTYTNEEIQNYVKAIEKILNDIGKGINNDINSNKEIDIYKEKCRNTITNQSKFTKNSMINTMSEIFEETYKNPNREKSENGEKLKSNIGITKELITASLMSDKLEYKWQCEEYEKIVYGSVLSKTGLNYKKELLKEKLWQYPLWRKLSNWGRFFFGQFVPLGTLLRRK